MKSFKLRFLISGILLGSQMAVNAASWQTYRSRPDSWYQSEEGRRVGDHVLSWQSAGGSWPKNIDTYRARCPQVPDEIQGTFDNGATTDQMRFVARAWRATQEERYAESFIRALKHILKAQYPTGGWPQYYPLSEQYHRHITFNDAAMVRVMELLREVAAQPDYAFVGTELQKAAQESFDRGIDCILKCQIRVRGVLTVWCAQHDALNYRPREGRSYELPSLSGGESEGILRLLMELDNPSDAVIAAVMAGAQWYERSQIAGWRMVWADGDRRVVMDEKAPALWARFYEIETNRPMFSNRDGKRLYDYNQLDAERSNGYSWLGDWGESVARDYNRWRKKWPDRIGQVEKRVDPITLAVAIDGSGDYRTVQAAIDALPDHRVQPAMIRIKPGIYRELVVIPRNKPFVYLIGTDAENTVITYDNNAKTLGADGKPLGTFRSASVLIEGNDFYAENITFENSFGEGSQALAVNVQSDRAIFRGCRLLGWQDTLLTHSRRQYFENCLITGHCDFIFGASLAWFEKCHIHCRADGYITAASTPPDQPYGLIFSECVVTADEGVGKVYLGRPWRSDAAVAWLHCEMPGAIVPGGWHNWGEPDREQTARYVEVDSRGPGARPVQRVGWARKLTADEIEAITIENVMADTDGWNPLQ